MASDPLHGHRGVARGGTDAGAAKAAEADQVAAQHRAERDRQIRQLPDEDPDRWSYGTLAAALQCSRELVALVLRRGR